MVLTHILAQAGPSINPIAFGHPIAFGRIA
jgi:hypothetical protein